MEEPLDRRTRPQNPELVGLPFRVILYTLDQVAMMLAVSQEHLEDRYLHFEGRSLGGRHPTLILARNIAPSGRPDWRVSEQELVRWCKRRKFKVIHRGFAS